MNKNENIVWVDWIRVLATIGVVFIHAASPLLYMYHKIGEGHWWIANIYDSILRMSVPLFFMISGFLLLQKHDSLWVFFMKRFHKILVPLFAWSVFYILWKGWVEQSTPISLQSFYRILYEPTYYHLWFLYSLVGVYLAVPVLRVIVQYSPPAIFKYGLGFWFVAGSLVPCAERLLEFKVGFDLKLLGGLAGYLLLGWMLGTHTLTKQHAKLSCLVACISALITAWGTYILTIRNEGILVLEFYGPLAPNVVLLAASVFVLLRYVVEHSDFAAHPQVLWVVHSVGSASFGIYLIHTAFLYLLQYGYLGIYLFGWRWNPLFAIPVVAGVTFCLSYGTIFILRSHHLTRRLAP